MLPPSSCDPAKTVMQVDSIFRCSISKAKASIGTGSVFNRPNFSRMLGLPIRRVEKNGRVPSFVCCKSQKFHFFAVFWQGSQGCTFFETPWQA